MLEEGHDEDGEDVELIRGEVVVKDVALPTVRHQETVAEKICMYSDEDKLSFCCSLDS